MVGLEDGVVDDFRLAARSPFQWDNTTNAGFSTNPVTWIPVADDYYENNLELQRTQPDSHLKLFKKLIVLRQNPIFKYGSLEFNTVTGDDILVYKRELEAPHADVYIVVLNLSESDSDVDLSSRFNNLPTQMQIVHSTSGSSYDEG